MTFAAVVVSNPKTILVREWIGSLLFEPQSVDSPLS